MRVADYIIKTLAERYGVEHAFLVVGGGAMHLNDAVGRCEKIRYTCNHHEQACAIAAEGYARITNKPALLMVTSGPGGCNTVTGVMGAWVDSIPMICVSGQVKRETTRLVAPNVRQLGDQEINIVDVVRPLTKYSVLVSEVADIRYHLERAMHLATSGRPGPVWLDIPLDIQSADIDPETLRAYDPAEDDIGELTAETLHDKVKQVREVLLKAKRPVIIAGGGVGLSGARDAFGQLIEKLGIPVLTTISGIDLIPSGSPLFFGRPGIIGERCANFIMQNSDCILILGTRMNVRILGFNFKAFAREAFKIMVDIDQAELDKPTLKLDLPVHADVLRFIDQLSQLLRPDEKPNAGEWMDYCRRIKEQYPVVLEKHREISDCVSSYVFPEVLSENLSENEIVVTGNGTAFTSTFQAMHLKEGLRMFASSGCGSMGYGLPASIGAAFAAPGKEVICITGDGSIQMNLQELQTVITYNLPIKIFMYNNDGYVSLRNTQNGYFSGNFVGSTQETGVVIPDMKRLAEVYGYAVYEIRNHSELRERLPQILNEAGPVFCEIITDRMESLEPKAASETQTDGTIKSKPLEDLAPFLPRDEFRTAMLIPPWEE